MRRKDIFDNLFAKSTSNQQVNLGNTKTKSITPSTPINVLPPSMVSKPVELTNQTIIPLTPIRTFNLEITNRYILNNISYVSPQLISKLRQLQPTGQLYFKIQSAHSPLNYIITQIDQDSIITYENSIYLLDCYHKVLDLKDDDIINCQLISVSNILPIHQLFVNVEYFTKSKSKSSQKNEPVINQDILDDLIKNLVGTTMAENFYFYIKHESQNWKIKIQHVEFSNGDSNCQFGRLVPETEIISTGQVRINSVFKMDDVSLMKLGIGGVDKIFDTITRRVFLTRMIPQKLYEKLGIKHTKGILLYGPPGTGKTALARSLSKLLNCKPPKIVNGPEILNKFIGESEKNIRELFKEAEDNPDELHLIVFDEFEAICKSRGGSGNGSINDSLVNQLLSKIDGINPINNVILIGMTNRKDLIDKAILRPGRFEVHIEIGLPDEHGRKQIFEIHTQTMRDNGFICDDVNFDTLAQMTENLTGAEIESLVREATSYAMGVIVDINNLKKTVKDADQMIVTMADFQLAIKNIKPMFGNDTDKFNQILNQPMSTFDNTDYHLVADAFRQSITKFKNGNRNFKSILVHGVPGSGKTYLSAQIAKENQFKFTKYLSAFDLVRCDDTEKRNRLLELIDDAKKSDESLVIIDDIDIMISWCPPMQLSNMMLQTIKTILSLTLTETKLCLILITNQFEDLESKLIFDRIDQRFEIPLIDGQTIKQINNI